MLSLLVFGLVATLLPSLVATQTCPAADATTAKWMVRWTNGASGLSIDANGDPRLILAVEMESIYTNVQFDYSEHCNVNPLVSTGTSSYFPECWTKYEMSVNYIDDCTFDVSGQDDPDATVITFSGSFIAKAELNLNWIGGTVARQLERPMLWKVSLPKVYSLTTTVTVKNTDQCVDNSDCHDNPCVEDSDSNYCNCSPCYSNDDTLCQYDLCGPDLICPSDMTISLTTLGLSGATLSNHGYTEAILPSATDNKTPTNQIVMKRSVDGGVWTDVSQTDYLLVIAFGTLGVHTVTYTATDQDNNQASCTFTVTVEDKGPPLLVCPPDATTTSSTYSNPTVNDLVWGDVGYTLTGVTGVDANGAPLSVSLPSDFDLTQDFSSVLVYGTYTFTFYSVDGSGNNAACTLELEYKAPDPVDTTPPTLTCPDSVTLELSSLIPSNAQPPATEEYSYNLTASDDNGLQNWLNHAGDISNSTTQYPWTVATFKDDADEYIIQVNTFGGELTLGTHTLSASVQDTFDNTASCSWTVTVVDVTPPVLTCLNILVEADSETEVGQVSAWTFITLHDNSLLPVELSVCQPNTTSDLCSEVILNSTSFPTGSYTLRGEGTDTSGNVGNCTFNLLVVDAYCEANEPEAILLETKSYQDTTTEPATYGAFIKYAVGVTNPYTAYLRGADFQLPAGRILNIEELTEESNCINREPGLLGINYARKPDCDSYCMLVYEFQVEFPSCEAVTETYTIDHTVHCEPDECQVSDIHYSVALEVEGTDLCEQSFELDSGLADDLLLTDEETAATYTEENVAIYGQYEQYPVLEEDELTNLIYFTQGDEYVELDSSPDSSLTQGFIDSTQAPTTCANPGTVWLADAEFDAITIRYQIPESVTYPTIIWDGYYDAPLSGDPTGMELSLASASQIQLTYHDGTSEVVIEWMTSLLSSSAYAEVEMSTSDVDGTLQLKIDGVVLTPTTGSMPVATGLSYDSNTKLVWGEGVCRAGTGWEAQLPTSVTDDTTDGSRRRRRAVQTAKGWKAHYTLPVKDSTGFWVVAYAFTGNFKATFANLNLASGDERDESLIKLIRDGNLAKDAHYIKKFVGAQEHRLVIEYTAPGVGIEPAMLLATKTQWIFMLFDEFQDRESEEYPLAYGLLHSDKVGEERVSSSGNYLAPSLEEYAHEPKFKTLYSRYIRAFVVADPWTYLNVDLVCNGQCRITIDDSFYLFDSLIDSEINSEKRKTPSGLPLTTPMAQGPHKIIVEHLIDQEEDLTSPFTTYRNTVCELESGGTGVEAVDFWTQPESMTSLHCRQRCLQWGTDFTPPEACTQSGSCECEGFEFAESTNKCVIWTSATAPEDDGTSILPGGPGNGNTQTSTLCVVHSSGTSNVEEILGSPFTLTMNFETRKPTTLDSPFGSSSKLPMLKPRSLQLLDCGEHGMGKPNEDRPPLVPGDVYEGWCETFPSELSPGPAPCVPCRNKVEWVRVMDIQGSGSQFHFDSTHWTDEESTVGVFDNHEFKSCATTATGDAGVEGVDYTTVEVDAPYLASCQHACQEKPGCVAVFSHSVPEGVCQLWTRIPEPYTPFTGEPQGTYQKSTCSIRAVGDEFVLVKSGTKGCSVGPGRFGFTWQGIHYDQVTVSEPAIANCMSECNNAELCTGIEVSSNSNGNCKLYKVPITGHRGNGQNICYMRKPSFESLGENTGCSGDSDGGSSGVGNVDYLLLQARQLNYPNPDDPYATFAGSCELACLKRDRCQGYEISNYDEAEAPNYDSARCELWLTPILSTTQEEETEGSTCFRRKGSRDKKYPAFNVVSFNQVRICVRGDDGHSDCFVFDAPRQYASMAVMFKMVTSGTRKQALDQKKFDMLFGNPEHQRCDPARAGINIFGAGNANARARIGYSLNTIESPCSVEDVDGVIGIGIKEEGVVPGTGQSLETSPYYIGAGWTNGFGHYGVHSGQEKEFEATLEVGVWQAQDDCGKGRQCIPVNEDSSPPLCNSNGDSCGDLKVDGCSGKSFSCLCFDGYTGEFCEIPPRVVLPIAGTVVRYPQCAEEQDITLTGYQQCIDDEGMTVPGVIYAIDFEQEPFNWAEGSCGSSGCFIQGMNFPHNYGFIPSQPCKATDCLREPFKHCAAGYDTFDANHGLTSVPLGQLTAEYAHPSLEMRFLPGLEECWRSGCAKLGFGTSDSGFYTCYTGPNWERKRMFVRCLQSAISDKVFVGPAPWEKYATGFDADYASAADNIMKTPEDANAFCDQYEGNWCNGYTTMNDFPMTSKTQIDFFKDDFISWIQPNSCHDGGFSCTRTYKTWMTIDDAQYGTSKKRNLDHQFGWGNAAGKRMMDWVHFNSAHSSKEFSDRSIYDVKVHGSSSYVNTNRYVYAANLPQSSAALALTEGSILEYKVHTDARWKTLVMDVAVIKAAKLYTYAEICHGREGLPEDSGRYATFQPLNNPDPVWASPNAGDRFDQCFHEDTELMYHCCAGPGAAVAIYSIVQPGDPVFHKGTYAEAEESCQALAPFTVSILGTQYTYPWDLCTAGQLKIKYSELKSQFVLDSQVVNPEWHAYTWTKSSVKCTPLHECVIAKSQWSTCRGDDSWCFDGNYNGHSDALRSYTSDYPDYSILQWRGEPNSPGYLRVRHVVAEFYSSSSKLYFSNIGVMPTLKYNQESKYYFPLSYSNPNRMDPIVRDNMLFSKPWKFVRRNGGPTDGWLRNDNLEPTSKIGFVNEMGTLIRSSFSLTWDSNFSHYFFATGDLSHMVFLPKPMLIRQNATETEWRYPTHVSDAAPVVPVEVTICSASSKCDLCQGHCTSDTDCVGDLTCFSRAGTQPVPGCVMGGRGDIEGYGYCHAPSKEHAKSTVLGRAVYWWRYRFVPGDIDHPEDPVVQVQDASGDYQTLYAEYTEEKRFHSSWCDEHDGCNVFISGSDCDICGCGVPYNDPDRDGVPTCLDECPTVYEKAQAGQCGCGAADADQDGIADCSQSCQSTPSFACDSLIDQCLNSPKQFPGLCGCEVDETDSDGDNSPDCVDLCPNDALKTHPGRCQCGRPDTDTDGDKVPDCMDLCPNDPLKVAMGECFCGNEEEEFCGIIEEGFGVYGRRRLQQTEEDSGSELSEDYEEMDVYELRNVELNAVPHPDQQTEFNGGDRVSIITTISSNDAQLETVTVRDAKREVFRCDEGQSGTACCTGTAYATTQLIKNAQVVDLEMNVSFDDLHRDFTTVEYDEPGFSGENTCVRISVTVEVYYRLGSELQMRRRSMLSVNEMDPLERESSRSVNLPLNRRRMAQDGDTGPLTPPAMADTVTSASALSARDPDTPLFRPPVTASKSAGPKGWSTLTIVAVAMVGLMVTVCTVCAIFMLTACFYRTVMKEQNDELRSDDLVSKPGAVSVTMTNSSNGESEVVSIHRSPEI